MTEDKVQEDSASMIPNRGTSGESFARAAARAELRSSDGETRSSRGEMIAPGPSPAIDGTALCVRILSHYAAYNRLAKYIGKCYPERHSPGLRVSTAVQHSASYGRGKTAVYENAHHWPLTLQ